MTLLEFKLFLLSQSYSITYCWSIVSLAFTSIGDNTVDRKWSLWNGTSEAWILLSVECTDPWQLNLKVHVTSESA